MDRESWKASVRQRVGDPTEAELPDSFIEASLDRGIREFSRYRPKLGWTQITLQRGVGTYTLPAAVFDVKDLWVSATPAIPSVFFDVLLQASMRADGGIGSDWDDLFRGYGFKPMDNAVWDWRVIGTQLTLHPQPDVDAVLVAATLSVLSEANLSETDQDAISLFNVAEACGYMGIRRNKPVATVPTLVGSMKLDTGATLLDLAREMRAEFHRRLGHGAVGGGRG